MQPFILIICLGYREANISGREETCVRGREERIAEVALLALGLTIVESVFISLMKTVPETGSFFQKRNTISVL